jgi:hypothetical protein
MYKFQFATTSSWLSIVAAALISLVGVPVAGATDYTYDLANISGSITTNCDNCILNSSDITAWSMSIPSFMSISSTTPGAQIIIPAGDTDMAATPTSLQFAFGGPYGGIEFSNPSAFLDYDDDQGDNIGFGPGEGVVAACQRQPVGNCQFFGGAMGTQSISVGVHTSPTSAPELDPRSLIAGLTLLFGLVAVFRGRRVRVGNSRT